MFDPLRLVRRKITVSTIILLLCFLLPLLSALVATTVSQATSQDEQIFQVPDIKLPEQGHLKLQSELFQLIEIENRGEASAFVQRSGVDLVDGMVRVVIEAAPGQARLAAQAAETLGTMVETIHADWVQVVIPISMLTALADTPSIDSVRLPQIPWPVGTSEGLDLINTPEWHSAGFTGAGVKVAILDLGFQGYDALLGTELPDSVTVQSFRSDGDITDSGQVHGTACAEIVYDIVPDADFYLVNFGTDVEWSNAVDWLIAQEVDVISSSIIWVNTGPGDGTGPICEKVAEARSAGILWSNAAGNQALLHWMGSWEDTDSDDWHEFNPGVDESNAIYADSGYPIVIFLKWDDPWGASSNDYNLYLFDDTAPVPNRVAWSQNVQNGNDDPVERLIYKAEYDGYYHIAIQEDSATEAVSFHLHTYYGDLQYRVYSGSLLEPADSSSAVTVGAVRWDNPDVLESFSSQGPTADGRTKPDLVAPDRVSTMSYGAEAFWGTSSSAPHVAGAAALVKDRHPSYTPADIQAFLEGFAVDLGDVGKDNLYGSGMLYLGPANTPPVVENVIASQREGTGFVDISYDLSDAEQNSINVSFQHWDGSSSWLDCVTITGDGATPTGTVKIGTWDAKADFDGQYCADCRIRIIADDGLPSNNIGQGDSPEFTLDTKNPTDYSCATPTDGDIEVPVNTVLTSLIASDDSPPITYKFMLAEDSGFTQGVQESDWLSTNSWNPTTLKSSHDYWWKMKAKDTFENGRDWCAVFTFTTVAPENQPPVADAGPDQGTLVGDTVTFDGSASSDLDGTIISYDWDFGDESTGTGITATHIYSATNTYTVTLTVTDNEGAIDTDTCIITVSSPGDGNTTVGALELKPTFQCISVYSNFAGDDNGDIPMTVDRRDTVISSGSTISNPYKNQWRASIFGLQPDTEYEVRVTYADSDGVAGSPVTATIKTRNDNPPSAGNIYYVATTGSDSNAGTEALPFRTIQKAADTVQAGDKVLIKAGTYDEKVTILASGTADNYITFMPYGDGDVVIDGRGLEEYGITIGVSGIVGTGSGTQQGGDYVRISGLKVINSRYAGINVGGDNVIIEDCEIRDFNVADDQNVDHRTSGITVNNWGASNLVIRGNLITRNIGVSGFNTPMGIHIYNAYSDQGGGHIIYSNQIIANDGNIKDGIGGLWNFSYPGSLYRDSDIYDNYIANCYDDGIESEGGNMNVRVWNNTIEDCRTMGLAFASTVLGPLYVFRNVVTGFTDAAFKLGGDSYGVPTAAHPAAME